VDSLLLVAMCWTVHAFLTTMGDAAWEDRIFRNLEQLDPDDFMRDAEAALTDGSARQKLLSQLTDYCLDFLLEYLPSMPIPGPARAWITPARLFFCPFN
jgi:hypothetical protein